MMRGGRHAVTVIGLALLMIATSLSSAVGGQTDDGDPIGTLSHAISGQGDRIQVRGWALDPDTADPVSVHLYVDGRFAAGVRADRRRRDVEAKFPELGADHGFKTVILGVVRGTHRVCAFALDRVPGVGARSIGCRTVTVGPARPFGALDSVSSPANGRIRVSGWAIDPNTTRPTTVHLYVGDQLLGTTRADRVRPDVARRYPGRRADHGFVAQLDGVPYGSHRVCAWAINWGPAAANQRVGCRMVNVVTDPDPNAGRRPLVVNGTGDVRTERGWYSSYSEIFSGLGGLFREDDLTVINLECAASRLGRPVPKNFNFRCDPSTIPAFAAAGVEVASQANNHALDFGVTGMLDAIEQLWSQGVAEVGAGRNQLDAREPALFEINGWRVAVVGLAGFVEFDWWIAGSDRPGLANGYDLATMTGAVRRAKEQADLVVVAIHWGREGVFFQNDSQTIRGRALIDAGADVVFGHHPHRLQPLEWYRGRPIFYSLGNFNWPRLSFASADTAVGQVVFAPDGGIEACFLDATIVAHGRPTLDDPSRRRC
ncbi:MAG: CapA family protein [Acidimicrobiales bacterium]